MKDIKLVTIIFNYARHYDEFDNSKTTWRIYYVEDGFSSIAEAKEYAMLDSASKNYHKEIWINDEPKYVKPQYKKAFYPIKGKFFDELNTTWYPDGYEDSDYTVKHIGNFEESIKESINANSILSKVEAIVGKTKIKHPRAEIIELDGTKYIYYSYFDKGFDDDGLDMVWDKCSDLKGVVDVGFGYGYGLENTKYEDSLLIELDDDVIVESKKSVRKSIKESSYFELVKAKEEGYDDYKHRNVGNPYKKGTDLYDAYWFGVEKAENESSGKTHTTFSDEEFDSIFGGKMCRKSIKESKNSSILDDEFYDLIEQGYIYDEDENGMNMSYGEYVAVSDDLWEILENELKYYRDFPSAYDAYNEIMDNTGDDVKMFMGISDDDYFYFEINEDENTYSFSGEVPTALEKLFKKFLKETDFERV